MSNLPWWGCFLIGFFSAPIVMLVCGVVFDTIVDLIEERRMK